MTPLPAAAYWRLRYLHACAERDAAAAEVTTLRAAGKAAQAHRIYTDALTQAGAAHGFDPTVNHAWDDTTTALVVPTETRT